MCKTTFLLTALSPAFILLSPNPSYAEYNPSAGRFLQRDRIEYEDGMNLYQYVNSKPVQLIDPLGYKICAPPQGSLLYLMQVEANKNRHFTKSGNLDKKKRISWQLLACLACQESGYNPCAKGPTNDYGLMQLTLKGALGECQKLGIMPKKLDTNEKSRKRCCGWDSQPKFGKPKPKTKSKDPDLIYSNNINCKKGCDNSIWNVENQVACAARYLRFIRDASNETVTIEKLICRYNKGIGSPECATQEKASSAAYTKSVMECLSNLGGGYKKNDKNKVVWPPNEKVYPAAPTIKTQY